jgi:glycosyltransferase involved in cell wall biosynthesis
MPTMIPLVPATPVWQPGVSVVVATLDAEAHLGACLASLRALDYPIAELIVVDRGSRDGTVAIATAAGARVLRVEGAPPALARNYGVMESTHEIVAFTDADCEVPTDWLTVLVEGLRGSKAAGVGGHVRLRFHATTAGAIEREAIAALVALSERVRGYVRESDGAHDVDHNPAANVAYIRHAFREARGYADDLWPGADVDLDLRLRLLGYRCRHVPGAPVTRDHPGTLAALAAEMRAAGRAHRTIVARHGRVRPLHFVPLALVGATALHGLLLSRRARPALLGLDVIVAAGAFALVATHVPSRLWLPALRTAAVAVTAWNLGYAGSR